MNRFSTWISILAISALAGSCIIINDDDDPDFCIKGQRHEELRTYSIPRIDGIQMFIPASVQLTHGPVQIIEVEGPPNVLDLLEFEIRNGVWEIDTRRCYEDAGLKFYLTLEDVEHVGLSGSGQIVSTNTLAINDLHVDLFGSGLIDLALDADDILVDLVGSGSVLLFGDGDDLNLVHEGSGNFGTFDFYCNEAEVTIEGSGIAELTVLDRLDVLIDGSGLVAYKGFPEINAQIIGSGSVLDAN